MERNGRESRIWLWSGASLVLIDGAIHLLEVSDGFGDAAYEGVLFIAAAAGALVVAGALLLGLRAGWLLRSLVAGGTLVAYLASRTTGLPAVPRQQFCLLGVVSLAAEGTFLLVAARAFMTERAQRAQRAENLTSAA